MHWRTDGRTDKPTLLDPSGKRRADGPIKSKERKSILLQLLEFSKLLVSIFH